jgi:hypothetical protein
MCRSVRGNGVARLALSLRDRCGKQIRSGVVCAPFGALSLARIEQSWMGYVDVRART